MPNVARAELEADHDPTRHAACARMHEAEIVAVGAATVDVVLSHACGPRALSTPAPTLAARLAVAGPYVPAVGDRVVVVGNADAHFVVGVISSTAAVTRLDFTGDVDVSASGKLRLRGLEGVEITGPEVQIRTGKLEMVARKVTQRFDELRQRVVAMLSVQAGTMSTVVDGSSFTRAESATLLTKEKVSINGKSIHLG